MWILPDIFCPEICFWTKNRLTQNHVNVKKKKHLIWTRQRKPLDSRLTRKISVNAILSESVTLRFSTTKCICTEELPDLHVHIWIHTKETPCNCINVRGRCILWTSLKSWGVEFVVGRVLTTWGEFVLVRVLKTWGELELVLGRNHQCNYNYGQMFDTQQCYRIIGTSLVVH